HDGPLDMRMDRRQERTAADLVNTAPGHELAQMIATYGEEPYSQAKYIAKLITDHRPFETTKQLADLIAATTRRGKKSIHPATRTFQALRIVVNDELGQLKELLSM